MNTKGLVKDVKIKLTDAALNILQTCTVFLSIVEGEDKQKAAELTALQI